jgi:hypothetical protein
LRYVSIDEFRDRKPGGLDIDTALFSVQCSALRLLRFLLRLEGADVAFTLGNALD